MSTNTKTFEARLHTAMCRIIDDLELKGYVNKREGNGLRGSVSKLVREFEISCVQEYLLLTTESFHNVLPPEGPC